MTATANARRLSKAEIFEGEARPQTPPVEPDNIPAELRERPQWVCWRWAQVTKKKQKGWTKKPINARSHRVCDYTDPKEWSSFDDAYAYYLHKRDKRDWTID